MTRLNLRSDKVVSQVQVNTKVGEPPHQSRCKSTLLLEKQWRMTEFGAEEDTTHIKLYIRGEIQSPIPKYASSPQRKEVYYKVKEQLLKMGIISQCIELDKMLLAINKDEDTIRQGEGQPFRQN